MEGTAETIMVCRESMMQVFDVVTSKIRDAFANEMRTSTATNDAEVLNRFMLYLRDMTTVSNLDGLAMLAQAFLWNDPAIAGSFIEQGTPVVIVAARAPPNSDQSKSRPLRTIHGHRLHQNSVISRSPKYSPTTKSPPQPRSNPVSAPQSHSPRRNDTQKQQQRLQPMFSSSSPSIASISPRFESESSTYGGLLPSLSHTLPFILSSTAHHTFAVFADVVSQRLSARSNARFTATGLFVQLKVALIKHTPGNSVSNTVAKIYVSKKDANPGGGSVSLVPSTVAIGIPNQKWLENGSKVTTMCTSSKSLNIERCHVDHTHGLSQGALISDEYGNSAKGCQSLDIVSTHRKSNLPR
ncbi:unnamed protein product [Aphanomyces euteiches]|nr:hypothetical protein Ae201684P_014747 [Aphanomyces euteiches]